MNHEILIETEVDGAEPYAGLLRRVIPAALEAEGVSFPCEVGALAGGDVAGLVACGVIFALPGVVFGCAYGLYEALKGRDDPDA